MGTTKQELEQWVDEGVRQKATHMIVVCDTFDYEDYPVYTYNDKECIDEYNAHNGSNMQRVMEVYDLRDSKEEQMKGARRVMRLPK